MTFIIYFIDLSIKKRVKTGAHIFTKAKNADDWKKKKIYIFLSYFISEILNFSNMDFFLKMLNVSSKHSFE